MPLSIPIHQRWGWSGDHLMLCLSMQESEADFHWLICKRQGDNVQALDQGKGSGDEALSRLLHTCWALPIVMTYDAASSVEAAIQAGTSDVLKTLLGIAVDRPQDFVYQLYPMVGAGQWGAVLRRDRLEAVWNRLGPHARRVLTVYLSPAIQGWLLPVNQARPYSFEAGGRCYQWHNGLSGETSASELSPVDLLPSAELTTGHLSAYAAAVAWHMGWGRTLEGWQDLQAHQRRLGQRSRWVRAVGYAGLTACLMLTLLFVGKGWLLMEQKRLQAEIRPQLDQLNLIRTQGQEIASQKHFLALNEAKDKQASRVSYWIDRMARLNPETVSWEEVWVFPSRQLINKKAAAWRENPPDILLKGRGTQAGEINAFKTALLNQPYVSQAQITQNEFDFSTHAHHFVLGVWTQTVAP